MVSKVCKMMKINKENLNELADLLYPIGNFDKLNRVITPNTYESDLLTPVYLAIGRLYNGSQGQDKLIDRYMTYWTTIFDYPDENPETFEKFYADTKKLIDDLKK